MTSRFFAFGAVAALTAVSAVSAVGPQQVRLMRPNLPGTSSLHAFGSRSAQQRASASGSKFDGALADISRHLNRVRPDHALQDLHTLAPAVRFIQPSGGAGPLVLIDAITRGDPQQLKAALVELGLQHAAVYSNDVGGWLPVSQLDAVTERTEVHSIRAAMPRARTGAVTSQGDFVQNSDVVRSTYSLSGAGVTVGVLSDSFDCYSVYATNGVSASGAAGYANNGFLATAATDVTTGDLPASVNVLEEASCMDYGAPLQLPFGDEGRAMLQIVHDVAPGASLAFYTAENSEADFASGIGKLADPVASGGAGATVIADDVGYFDEPFYQDGIVAQAIDAVEAQGVAYFSAAGNDGTYAYDNNSPSFATVSTSSPNSGEQLLNFDSSGESTTTSLPVTIPAMVPGEFVAIVVEWDQPYVTGAPDSGGATSAIDLCITGATGNDIIANDQLQAATCSGASTIGLDPYQVMLVDNPANASGNSKVETINIQVGLVSGTAPGRIKVTIEGDGLPLSITQFATNSPTIQGHPGAAGAAAVGAAFFLNTQACGTSPATLESYSSMGGDPILFDVNGTRLATPVYRQKPDFVAPDGGNDTFLGFTLASAGITDTSTTAGCENNANYPNFFGTSAATPHAASIAALMLQANSSLSPTSIYQALRTSAFPMASAVPDQNSGYGFIQANHAIVAPAMTLANPAIPMGQSTTLGWSTGNATSCVATGSWSGTFTGSGSQQVAITTTGTNNYGLTCSNSAGVIFSSEVFLTDVVPSAPTISISSNSIVYGGSVTITWDSLNATNCTASGSWSGTLAPNGTAVVAPTAPGNSTYSLTCANSLGSSSVASVALTASEPAVPTAPTLTLGATTLVIGTSTTLTWSSTSATGCTATGSWSGSQNTSGSQTISPTPAGSYTYSLSCANAAGSSPVASVTLTVNAIATQPGPSSGGGGALGVTTLLGLAGLSLMRLGAGRSRGRRRIVSRQIDGLGSARG